MQCWATTTPFVCAGHGALGIRVLMNESVQIERAGERWPWSASTMRITSERTIFTKLRQRLRQMLCDSAVAHARPYRHAAHADFSLMLCGHTHGGQICLPAVADLNDSDAPRAFARGAWQYHGMRLHVGGLRRINR